MNELPQRANLGRPICLIVGIKNSPEKRFLHHRRHDNSQHSQKNSRAETKIVFLWSSLTSAWCIRFEVKKFRIHSETSLQPQRDGHNDDPAKQSEHNGALTTGRIKTKRLGPGKILLPQKRPKPVEGCALEGHRCRSPSLKSFAALRAGCGPGLEPARQSPWQSTWWRARQQKDVHHTGQTPFPFRQHELRVGLRGATSKFQSLSHEGSRRWSQSQRVTLLSVISS